MTSTNIIKYPKTFNLPYSMGTTNDAKKLKDDKHFIGKEVVITEKLDGENTSATCDRLWARSVDSKDHPSRNWIQQFWNQLKYDIPSDMRICGENVYAKHSLTYDKLTTYFYVFSIWKGKECLSWDDTVEWCALLGLEHVPVVYRGIYDKQFIIDNHNINSTFGPEREGLVIRFPHSFHYDDFSKSLTKIVRKSHVQTDKHWMSQAVVPNKLLVGG